MADYKNFFSANDPLNLYGKDISLLSNSTEFPFNKPINTKELEDENIKQREEENKRLLEQIKQEKAKFDSNVATNFVTNLQQALRGERELNLDLYNSAYEATLNQRDLETGKLLYPIRLAKHAYNNLLLLQEEYERLSAAYNTFAKEVKPLVNEYSDLLNLDNDKLFSNNLDSYKDEVAKLLLYTGNYKDEEEVKQNWEGMSDSEKWGATIYAIGRKYFENDSYKLDKFLSLNDRADRLAMLVSAMKSSPFYESENAKYKKDLDLAAYNIAGNIFDGLEDLLDWGNSLHEDTEDIIKNGGLFNNSVLRGTRNFFGAATSLIAGTLHGIGSLIQSGIKATYGELTNSKEEKTDELVNQLDASFIEKEAQERKEDYLDRSIEEKVKLAERFDRLSEQNSPTYKLAKGTSLTKLVDDTATKEEEIDAKVSKLAELETAASIHGEEAAVKNLEDFWKETTAHNLGAINYITNTVGTGVASLSSDGAAFLAATLNIINPSFLATTFTTINPLTITEGYSDALINHNFLMDIASKVLEWGEEKFHTYKTAEEEDAFLSWRDAPDLIGQYGFTVASKWISMAGSEAARSASKFVAKQALKLNLKGKFATGLIGNKELRKAIKEGIKSGKGTEEYTKALEAINQVLSKRLYNLNLAVGAAVGSAEGALEAKLTYDKFIEDNNQNQVFDERKKQIENASPEQLEEYMRNANYQPAGLKLNKEGVATAFYSPEQYELARLELLDKNESIRSNVNNKVEDNALDAAAANFMANSLINGAANVLLKESLLSNDVKHAARRMKGKTKGITDMIDVVEGDKGWVARVKDGLKDKNKNVWLKIGAGSKEAAKIVWEGLKTSAGEALEEYGQTISDDISRAALQSDLNNYLSTVYDSQAHDAFNTDLLNILDAGLSSISTSMNNREAIKAGIFGAISTLGGGIDYGNVITGAINAINNKPTSERWSKEWFKEVGKNIAGFTSGLYDGALIQAYRESKEQGETALKIAENVNQWLNNESNQELLTHLGGAIGFKKMLDNALISRDSEEARDNKLSLAIENIFMLKALEGTLMADAYNKEIDDHIALSELTTQENLSDNFDDQGNFIGENKLAKSAITAFKELLGQNDDSMTDLQIVLKVAQNAQEFRELQQKIDAYSKQVEQMYHEDNLDPIVQQAYVLAMALLDKYRSRKEKLKHRLNDIFDTSKNDWITEEDKELIEKKSGLDLNTINILTKYGSIKKAEKALKEIQTQKNSIETALGSKKSTKEDNELESNDRRELKSQKRLLEMQEEVLATQIANAKEAAKKRQQNRNKQNKRAAEIIEGKVEDSQENIPQEEVETIPEEIFTVGDMIGMSSSLRSQILNNKSKYSQQQLEEIDAFITLSKRLLANLSTYESSSQENDGSVPLADIELTEEEVKQAYTDLSALESKSAAYDNYLYSYIQNPQFLTAVAQNLKNKLRKKTLKFYYKDDLRLRPEETTIDMMDRLLERIEVLRELGKHEDAAILESIVNEDPVLSKVHNALKETEIRVAASVKYSKKWEDREEEANLAITGLRALISASGMSIKDIKEALDNNDFDSIKKQLLKKLGDKFILDTLLEKSGLKALLSSNVNTDTVLLPLIQNIKDILDVYYQKKEVTKASGKSLEITPKPQVRRELLEATIPAEPLRQRAGHEEGIISIVTPGNIDINSRNPLKVKLRMFLDKHGVSSFLYKMKKPDKVKFIVTSKFGAPEIFAVVPVAKPIEMSGAPGKYLTFNINGTSYLIIGHVEKGNSATLDEIAEATYSTLSLNSAKLLQDRLGDIEFECNYFLGEAKSVSDDSIDSSRPRALNEQLTTPTQVDGWVDEFVNGGIVEEEKDAQGYTTVTFYAYRYPVTILKVPAVDEEGKIDKTLRPRSISLFNIPIENLNVDGEEVGPTTVGEFIVNPNYTTRLKIQALKLHDSFFSTFFKTWVNYSTTNLNWSDSSIYRYLIGNFIYLGHPEEEHRNSIHPAVNDGILTIDNSNLDGKVTFQIPNYSSNDPEAEELALQALRTIMDEVYLGNLIYSNPTINRRVIDRKNYKNISKGEKDQEKGILKGLILLGVLQGLLPQAINREIKVLNNYYKGSRRTNGNNPNIATPDNSNNEGKKESMKDKIKKELTEGLKKAQKIVDRIINTSKSIDLPEKDSNSLIEDDDSDLASYYEGNGRRYARVTSTEEAAIGHNKKPVNITGNKKVMSTSHGNTLDAVQRKALEILISSEKLYGLNDADALYNELIKDKIFNGKIPNYPKGIIIPWLKEVISFYNIAYDNNWTIVPDGIKAVGELDVYDGDKKIGVLPTAGTLDLLLYDENGDFFIIDLKTRHRTSTMHQYDNEVTEGWTIQINDYLHLLLQLNSDMTFTGKNYVLASSVDYGIPTIRVALGEDRMTIRYVMPNGSVGAEVPASSPPKFMRSDLYTHEVLVPIKQEETKGLDYSRLSLEHKDMVIPIDNSGPQNNLLGDAFNFKQKQEEEQGPAKEVKPEIKEDSTHKAENAAAPVDMKSFLALRRKGGNNRSKKSARTTRQARFVDFINNHIAPINEAKINIVGKIKLKIKEFLDTRDTYLKLMISDLANTFFQGNVHLVNSILKGIKITPANMPLIVSRLKSYFQSYINNENVLIANAQKRQQSYKLLYDYLKGSISEEAFLDGLYNLNIESKDLPELIDYINSTDKENEKRRIILKLENSTIHTLENVEAVIKALKSKIDNMKTKLEFLEYPSAHTMLNTRMQSIKTAITNGRYSQVKTEDSNESMNKLLNKEDGLYGVEKLLEHIMDNSKNTFFRQLSRVLRLYVRLQHLYITVTLDDLMLNVEGESNGKTITIYKNSVNSYEQLERVLLHEILHSVLLVSPSIKNQLSEVINKAIANIARSTGKSIQQIKLEYYGLTNEDEFISEFFTNYSFQEMLKTITDNESVNMTDRIIHKILNIVGKENNMYNQAYKIMQDLLRENSLEELQRKEESIEELMYIRHNFNTLEKQLLKAIESRGITKEEYNNMTAFEQLHLEECCR